MKGWGGGLLPSAFANGSQIQRLTSNKNNLESEVGEQIKNTWPAQTRPYKQAWNAVFT